MSEIITDLSILSTPAEPLEFLTDKGVEKDEGESIIKQLKEVLASNENILAISAPQIGINKRIFCIKFNDVIKTFINPIVTKKSGSVIAPETCASLPGKEILIARPAEVTVVYYNDDFKYEDNKLMGPAAAIFDQQAQLLDGITPDVLGLVSDVAEDGSLADLNEEEIKELKEFYKQYVETKLKAINSTISDDPEVQAQLRKLKFTEDVINGRSAVVGKDGPKLNRAQRRALAKRGKNRKGGKK